MATPSTLNKSFPLKNPSCPGSPARSPYPTTRGERNIHQRRVFGNGEQGLRVFFRWSCETEE